MSLHARRILLGISGGIAAYKSPELVRRLRDAGAEVRVMMTASAQTFITPLTLQAVSGRPVHHKLLSATGESGMGQGESGMDHIELARWAELILLAPATANLMARLAHGFADDIVTATCLASDARLTRLALAPAMNQMMWQHAATQSNVHTLETREVVLLGPSDGAQACGEYGDGRMLEPTDIAERAALLLAPPALSGLRIMVTSGPTWEPLDPVRGLSNRSSGQMGHAMATAAIEAGAELTLVSGPGTPPPPPTAHNIPVVTCCEMDEVVQQRIADTDIFIGVAAVADYRPVKTSTEKIKKAKANMHVEFAPNPDILKKVAARRNPPFTVGFAAETSAVKKNARAKLADKKVDMICANHVGNGLVHGEPGIALGIGASHNAVTVLAGDGTADAVELGPCSKALLARQLVQEIAKHYHARHRT